MRKAKDFILVGLSALVLASGVLALAACGSSDPSSSGPTKAKSGKAHKSAAKPGEEALTDMVAAVSASKPGPPVEMKFVLTSRPEVGQIVDVDVAVVPLDPVPDDLAVSFQAVEGIEVVEGSQIEKVEKLAGGSPIRHVVKLLPKRDGIFAMTATVSFSQSNQSFTRTFTIPMVAGEGLPEQVAKGP
jgi:hypothetical protein